MVAYGNDRRAHDGTPAAREARRSAGSPRARSLDVASGCRARHLGGLVRGIPLLLRLRRPPGHDRARLAGATLPPRQLRRRRHHPARRAAPTDRRERLASPAGATSRPRCRLDRRSRLLDARPHPLLTLRVLSLTGVHPIDYPPGLWLSIDRREADLQDVFN